MKYVYSLGGGESFVRSIMVKTGGANALKVGAGLIMSGVTMAPVVANGSNLADFVGVLQDGVPATPDFALGTADLRAKVLINPLAVFRAQMDATSVLTATSSSGTTVTVGSLVTVPGQWVYVVSGTGAGQLILVATGGTGSFTASIAPSPVLDNTSKVLVLQQVLSEINGLSSDGTKLTTTAAAPTGACRTLANYISSPGVPEIELDPLIHNGVTIPGLTLLSDIVFLDHAFNVSA